MRSLVGNRKARNIVFLLSFLILSVTVTTFIVKALSQNGERVALGSELTYYLTVNYDGIDKEGNTSNDTSIRKVTSDIIEVEDKLPDGLTFLDFIKITDDVFRAIKRDNSATGTCNGYVIDDTNDAFYTTGTWNSANTEYTYHGLHYDKNTNLVSFRIKDLTAGCKVSIGIVTKAPDVIDDPNTTDVEIRRDFYNTAQIKEGNIVDNSNTLHNYIFDETKDEDEEEQNGNVKTVKVKYEYENDGCKVLGNLPPEQSYATGSEISVAGNKPDIDSMEFLGWEASGITVGADGKFIVPDSDITFVGKCHAISTDPTDPNNPNSPENPTSKKHYVTYEINGEGPSNFKVPQRKIYEEGETIKIDSLASGYEKDGYRFLGWETTDATVVNGEFVMPDKNVTITGEWEQILYDVEYEYLGELPSNAGALLPSKKSVKANTLVYEADTEDQGNYIFHGWNLNNFKMPAEDVQVSGVWTRANELFEPEITLEVENPQPSYRTGDTLTYRITVKNNESFPIRDIAIDDLDGEVTFPVSLEYNSRVFYLTIPTIDAGGEISFTYEYVLTQSSGSFTHTVELTEAYSDEQNTFLRPVDYKRSVTINIDNTTNPSGPTDPNSPSLTVPNTGVFTFIKDHARSFSIVGLIIVVGVAVILIVIARLKGKKINKITLSILAALVSVFGSTAFVARAEESNSTKVFTSAVRTTEFRIRDTFEGTKTAYWTDYNEATLEIETYLKHTGNAKWDKVLIGLNTDERINSKAGSRPEYWYVSQPQKDYFRFQNLAEGSPLLLQAKAEQTDPNSKNFSYDFWQINKEVKQFYDPSDFGYFYYGNIDKPDGVSYAVSDGNRGIVEKDWYAENCSAWEDYFIIKRCTDHEQYVNYGSTYYSDDKPATPLSIDNSGYTIYQGIDQLGRRLGTKYKDKILVILIGPGVPLVRDTEVYVPSGTAYTSIGRGNNYVRSTERIKETRAQIKKLYPNATIITIGDKKENYDKFVSDYSTTVGHWQGGVVWNATNWYAARGTRCALNETVVDHNFWGGKEYYQAIDNGGIATACYFIGEADMLINEYLDHAIKNVEFDIIDTIADQFYVESVDDIEFVVGTGQAEIYDENGKQKVRLTGVAPTESAPKVKIKLKVKDAYKDLDDFLPTNDDLIIRVTDYEDGVNATRSTSTPVLEHMKTVTYESNAPSGCSLTDSTERRIVYDIVEFKDEPSECGGYNFRGWEIVTDDVDKVTDGSFIMPDKDVLIRGIWGKASITKSAEVSGYKITLKADEGYFASTGEAVSTLTYNRDASGTMVTSDTYEEPIVCPPYGLSGWYKDKAFTEKVETSEFNSFNSSVTLYAKYDIDDSKIVSGNFATGVSGLIDSSNSSFVSANDPDSNPRYVGSCPNNYVTFNGETWRVVGVFGTTDESGDTANRVKLVRNESIGNYSWDVSPKSTNEGFGINEWSQADIKETLNSGTYWNKTSGTCYAGEYGTWQAVDCDFSGNGLTDSAKQLIASVVWHTSSANLTDTAAFKTPQELYNGERSGNTTVKGCVNTTYCIGVDNVPRKATWTGKVALLHPSDYVYSIDSNLYSQCHASLVSNYKGCYDKSYLFKDAFSAMQTSSSRILIGFINPARSIGTNSATAVIDTTNNYVPSDAGANWSRYVYPSVFLNSNAVVTGGQGTKDEPYIVSLP